MNPQPTTATETTADRYLAPDFLTRKVFNPIMTGLVKLGISVRGARELHVRGRTSGEWRTVPVNPLDVGGVTYLVSPRGHTQWSRNLRAAGSGRLRRGRRFDDFTAVEVADGDKAPIIRDYLDRWSAETSRFFEGLHADSTDAEIEAIAPSFPVFEIVMTS